MIRSLWRLFNRIILPIAVLLPAAYVIYTYVSSGGRGIVMPGHAGMVSPLSAMAALYVAILRKYGAIIVVVALTDIAVGACLRLSPQALVNEARRGMISTVLRSIRIVALVPYLALIIWGIYNGFTGIIFNHVEFIGTRAFLVSVMRHLSMFKWVFTVCGATIILTTIGIRIS